MKKLLVAMLLGVLMTLVACGNEEVDVKTEVNYEEVGNEIEEVAEEEVEEVVATHTTGFGQIDINGTVLTLGMDLTENIIAELGVAIEVLEAPSCHFDGNDTIYTYDNVILYVYQDGENNILYIIEITDSTITTNTGVTVGMAREEVVEIYGAEYDEYGTILEYTLDEANVAISFDVDGFVEYIEIF